MSEDESPVGHWPNKFQIVDGVVPTEEVSQDPHLFDDDDIEELEREMED